MYRQKRRKEEMRREKKREARNSRIVGIAQNQSNFDSRLIAATGINLDSVLAIDRTNHTEFDWNPSSPDMNFDRLGNRD